MLAEIYLPSHKQLDVDILDLVDRFNHVAGDERDSIQERTILLKQIFFQMVDLALQEIDWAREEPEYADEAIDRSDFIADVIGARGYCNAPDLVRQGILDKDFVSSDHEKIKTIWTPLADYRDQQLSHLRLSIDTMKKQQETISLQRTAQRPLRLKHSGLRWEEQLEDAPEGRIVPLPIGEDRRLRLQALKQV